LKGDDVAKNPFAGKKAAPFGGAGKGPRDAKSTRTAAGLKRKKPPFGSGKSVKKAAK